MDIEGWIDEVDNGVVFGRCVIDGETLEFDIDLLDVPECQRVDLAPGSYVRFVNGGYLLVHKTMWTSHHMEQAKASADRLWKALGWDKRS